MRALRLASVVFMTAALSAACHDKKGQTSPAGGSGSGSGLASGSGSGTDVVGGNDGGDPGLGSGTGSGDGGGTGSGDGGGTGSAVVPAPPNLDVASRTLEECLAEGSKALSAVPPDANTAISAARSALEVDSTSVVAVVMLARAYFEKKLYETALQILLAKEAELGGPKDASLYYVKGLIYDKTNQPEKAVNAYQKAIELKPGHRSALIKLGVHQLGAHQFEDAVKTYLTLTGGTASKDAATWSSLGAAYRGTADAPPPTEDDPTEEQRQGYRQMADAYKQAAKAYEKAMTLDADYGPAYYNLGLLYLDSDPWCRSTSRAGCPFAELSNKDRLQKAKKNFELYKAKNEASKLYDAKLYDDRMQDVEALGEDEP